MAKRYNHLYEELFSYENLTLAHKKARKHKTLKPYVIAFEENLEENLLQLQHELITSTYKPKPLETFILRDPKTRKISKSDFRDRIIHHAICNILEPLFDKTFIYDSYANRVGKGTHKALKRFEQFKRRITQNNTKKAYALKADVKHYFETVDHNILLGILQRKIADERIVNLARIILQNHQEKIKGKGMPLGNLTSQFFANIYLNALDQYIKHDLKARYYIRYVDDFVLFHTNKEALSRYFCQINTFLKERLALELHPEKSKVYLLKQGVPFLGIRIYPFHLLLAKRNIRKFKKKLEQAIILFEQKKICYDPIYDLIEGWVAYSNIANNYTLRKRMLNCIEQICMTNLSTKEYNRYQRKPTTTGEIHWWYARLSGSGRFSCSHFPLDESTLKTTSEIHWWKMRF